MIVHVDGVDAARLDGWRGSVGRRPGRAPDPRGGHGLDGLAAPDPLPRSSRFPGARCRPPGARSERRRADGLRSPPAPTGSCGSWTPPGSTRGPHRRALDGDVHRARARRLGYADRVDSITLCGTATGHAGPPRTARRRRARPAARRGADGRMGTRQAGSRRRQPDARSLDDRRREGARRERATRRARHRLPSVSGVRQGRGMRRRR